VLQLFLSSSKPVLRFAAVRTLNKVGGEAYSQNDCFRLASTALATHVTGSTHKRTNNWWLRLKRSCCSALTQQGVPHSHGCETDLVWRDVFWYLAAAASSRMQLAVVLRTVALPLKSMICFLLEDHLVATA
jgi:hypothetical protein